MTKLDDIKTINVSDLLCALDSTGISIFTYFPQERKIVIPEELCKPFTCKTVYYGMPYSFAEECVCPEDRADYIAMYELIDSGEQTASARFRNIDQSEFLKDTLTTITRDEEGKPLVVFGVVADASDSFLNDKLTKQLEHKFAASDDDGEMAEVMETIASSIGQQYCAIYHIWIEENCYVCFQEKMGGILTEIGERGDYNAAWDIYVQKNIVPEDQTAMRGFAELSTLSERLGNHNSISHTYRRNGMGWTRGTFFAGKRNSSGEVISAIFTVADINREVELEEAQKKIQYEAEHDMLTGIYNRKGFDAVLKSGQINSEKVGFAILDVDNFKALNDNFGHSLGDDVLVAVAEQLVAIFYQDDIVARIGGDEFAILLKDCDVSAWNKFCAKISTLHATMLDRFPEELELSVTISAGISFSAEGYNHQMYQLADVGLYETKRHGRAGCTLVSQNHEILDYWQDNRVSLLAQTVKEYNRGGLPSKYDNLPYLAMQKLYEERLQSLAAVTEGTMSMSILNLTRETYELVECMDSVRPYVNTSLPLKEYLLYAATAIVGEKDQQRFREMFSIDSLMKQAAAGKTHQQIEYLLKISESHYEWVLSAIDLVQNPLTGEVTGAVYSKSLQKEKMNQVLLGKALEQAYLFVAVIFVSTDEFYLYNYHENNYSACMSNYWNVALRDVRGRYSREIERELDDFFTKEKVLKYLENHTEYIYAYNGTVNNKTQRLEIRFSYADDMHTMLLASMRNITDDSLLERYRHDSEHDQLTDLFNRNTLFRKCRELLAAHPDVTFAMIHADIKHFRLYNTFFGDEAGDELLRDISDFFRWMDADYSYWAYGRIEADVFAAFIPYNEAVYRKHMNRGIKTLKEYRTDFPLTPAIGMYFVTDTNMPIEAMFTRASLAAKTVQPNSPYATVVFDESMENKLLEDQKILNEMKTAIEEEQFQVYLQPKYSLLNNKPVGAEALARWVHPAWGIVPTGRFISLFESNGYIATLDHYMWEKTCQILYRWKKSGKSLMPISVNVSRISAYSQDTVPVLKSLVEKYGIEPGYLELELTESAFVESPEEMRERLAELQEYGFKILMDDFGSGYSSLNTLIDLPIDILKLDMKFLSYSEKERGMIILSSIIGMSKQLKLPVIAEGVETESQAEYLRNIACEYVQGYLYARPMPVEEYEEKVIEKLQYNDEI